MPGRAGLRGCRISGRRTTGPQNSVRLALVTAVLMTMTVLSGCGGDPEDTYCSAVRDEKPTLDKLARESKGVKADVVTPTLEAFERLQKQAPPELADEYQTVVFAYQDLVAAIHRAGIDPRGYRPGERPQGLSGDDAHELAAVAAKLGSPRVTDAVAGIEQHAREVCHVTFG